MSIKQEKKKYIFSRIASFKQYIFKMEPFLKKSNILQVELESLVWEYDSLVYLIDSVSDLKQSKDQDIVRICYVNSVDERNILDSEAMELRAVWNKFVDQFDAQKDSLLR